MMHAGEEQVFRRIEQAGQILLLLDYDGTLAEFAPTPDTILPDQVLQALLRQCSQHSKMRVAIISGRRLAHIRELVGVEGITMMGTYGLEHYDPKVSQQPAIDFAATRKVVEAVKQVWQEILIGQDNFYLEDKGLAVAIHGSRAKAEVVAPILAEASEAARPFLGSDFALLGGNRFLEFAPRLADKGLAIQKIARDYQDSQHLVIFIGDDDKDEPAFDTVTQLGGIAIRVGQQPVETQAQYHLDTPEQVRDWLKELIRRLDTA